MAYKIFNDVGYGFSEKYYQTLFAVALKKESLPYKKEVCAKLVYGGKEVSRLFLDFVVDDKVVIELKVRPSIGYSHIRQVVDYLKSCNYKLAILIYFTREGVKYRRVLNAGY